MFINSSDDDSFCQMKTFEQVKLGIMVDGKWTELEGKVFPATTEKDVRRVIQSFTDNLLETISKLK